MNCSSQLGGRRAGVGGTHRIRKLSGLLGMECLTKPGEVFRKVASDHVLEESRRKCYGKEFRL